MTEIGRLLTAMVTPFTADGSVDWPQAQRLARALVASGTEGLVIAGTTGESPTLAVSEKLRLFSAVKQAVGDTAAVIAGTGNYSTQESIELTREACELGVDAVMAVVPYYNKPPQEGLYRHFAAIAAASTRPVILYNVPSRTITNMTAETTLRLAQVPNIIGVKEASGNYEQIAAIIEGAPAGFRVWSGNDSDTLSILGLGGYGIISVASHLVGQQIQAMIRAFLDGDSADAARRHRRMLPLVQALFVITSPIPVKYLLNQAGFPVGECRLPLCPPDSATMAKLDAILARYQVDLPTAVPA